MKFFPDLHPFALQVRRPTASSWTTLLSCGRRELLVRLLASIATAGEIRVYTHADDLKDSRPHGQTN